MHTSDVNFLHITCALSCLIVKVLEESDKPILLRCFDNHVFSCESYSHELGNLTEFNNPDGWEFQQELQESYGQVVKVHGLFGRRELFVFDPAALHSILVQDQDIYEPPETLLCLNGLLLGKGIFSTANDDHRRYRKIMTPAFSTANLRGMIPLFYEVAERARDGLIAPTVIDAPQTIDMNSILCRTSLEFIGCAGIDYSFDPMLPGKEQTDRYSQALKAMLPTAYKMQPAFPLLPFVAKVFFLSFLRRIINFIPLPALHELRDIVDFTYAIPAELVQNRKAAIEKGGPATDNDHKSIMSLMMKSNASAESAMHMTDKELVAATSMIILAATDTTSSAMNRMLHILAMYPDVQEKLRSEILAAPEHLDHDTLTVLPYLDGIVHEILRLAMADTVLPLSKPITGLDGAHMRSIKITKGTSIHVAIAAGEDALEFKPERWTNDKADSVTTKISGVYGNILTFIGGGRSCIGFQFAQLEMKVVACVLLRSFKFSAPDPRIQWRKTGLTTSPYIDNQSALPILVERLKTRLAHV
ncbi:cytochrome P450 [Mycena albidolilacea]|uniref:Cytochrome P450 n=1 Tax=Mycena albidolilacea TaxID=1033008 RepID=A0AAD6ZB51_9AGAR|nr:cytochrome P450 [Mycena albidolilacea]